MRVLITNYSSASQTVLKAVMIKLGHKVEVVGDGKAALASLELPAGPKLAILDSYLPGMDGFEVCRKIKAAPDSKVSVILMTRENDRTEVLKALDAGADDYLQKPFDATELTARLRILDRESAKRQQLAEQAAGGGAAAPEADGSSEAPGSPRAKEKTRKLFTDNMQDLNTLGAFSHFENLMTKVFADMGLGEASVLDADNTAIDAEFSILSVLVLPEKTAWLDIVLEMDRASAHALFKTMTGSPEESRDELVDMAGEALNMIMGAIKSALQEGYIDVLTPVIPFKVPPEKREKFSFISTECSQHAFSLPGITMRVTIFPHITSVVTKTLDDIKVRDVTISPVKLPGSPKLLLLNKGTMVNDNHLRRLREMTGCGFIKVKFDMISPSQISACTVKV
ncbi:MAG: response regulator [Chthoniobacteraceae bacterium]|nr:response regulator [Chthoniobacteraceae bacterium]